MANSLARSQIDLSASAARVEFAREFARFQARIIEDAAGNADELQVDLMYLADEGVLVLEDTHCLLQALVAEEKGQRPPVQDLSLPPYCPAGEKTDDAARGGAANRRGGNGFRVPAQGDRSGADGAPSGPRDRRDPSGMSKKARSCGGGHD